MAELITRRQGAVATILFVVLLLATLVQMRFLKRKVHYA